MLMIRKAVAKKGTTSEQYLRPGTIGELSKIIDQYIYSVMPDYINAGFSDHFFLIGEEYQKDISFLYFVVHQHRNRAQLVYAFTEIPFRNKGTASLIIRLVFYSTSVQAEPRR